VAKNLLIKCFHEINSKKLLRINWKWAKKIF
jgi:hypothetical protein